MADTTISKLPIAVGLDGSEIFPVVQRGVTLRATLDQVLLLKLPGVSSVSGTPNQIVSQDVAGDVTLSLAPSITGLTSVTSNSFVGTLTGNADTATSATLASTVTTNANLTGDVTSVGNATTLSSVIAAGGPVGSSSVVPVISYDAKGRLTTVSTATITASGLGAELQANKDASNGYAGLTLFKLNLKNAANTFINFLTNATTAARTWTFPDRSMTVAGVDDITGGTQAGSFTSLSASGQITALSAPTAMKVSNAITSGRASLWFESKNSVGALKYTYVGHNIYYADSAFEISSGTTGLGLRVLDSGEVACGNGLSATGVVNLGSGQFYKDASGNIGIGSTSPISGFSPNRSYLSLKGRGTVNGDGIGVVQFQTTIADAIGNNLGNIEWTSNSGARLGYITTSYATSSSLDMAFSPGGTGTGAMILKSSGSLGVNVVPVGMLQVYNLNAGNPATSGTTDANLTFSARGQGAQLDIGTYTSGAHWIQSRGTTFSNNYDLVLNPNGGSVGIGTATPSEQLTQYLASGTTFRSIINGSIKILEYASTSVSKALYGTASNTNLSITTNNTIKASFGTDGSFTLVTPAGLGYGAGSGGTVTQATSKSATVTLNKPCGTITMNAATLGAGAVVQFVVANSLCAVGDTVIANVFGFGNYKVDVAYLDGSGFSILVTNRSGGALAEAVQINFAIIKGSTT